MKIYGPYLRKDNRKHVVIVNDNVKTTMSYARYLMECHLGRKLLPHETIDHINNDCSDDRIENLQILSRKDNSRKEMLRPERVRKYIQFKCPNCGEEVSKPLNHVKGNLKKGKSGPFCSRKCAGQSTYKNPWS